jgi:O-antigen/teichoic acid export membrane protein
MTEKLESSGISQRSYSALLWNNFGSAVRMAFQFLIGIVLARLLGPEAFGIVAIGWLMVGIGNLVADFGLSAAVIQSKTLEEKDIRFAFTAQVMFGAALTLIGYFSAKHVAVFFHRVDAGPIIQAMAFLFLLQSFGQTAGALLQRSLNFKAYQAINIASYLTGYLLIGIPCAYYGLGAWSLVAAQLVQSLMFSLVAMWHSKQTMKPAFKPSSPGMFSFGGKVIGANLTSWCILNLDSLVIGRMLGVANLGIYNRAMALIGTPINTLTASLQGVLFAASSRAQADTTQLKKGYFAATAVIGLISLPLAATVASVPETVVTAIYGEQWLAAIPVLAPLALAMAIHALLAVVGPVLMAQNKVGLELRAQLITLLVMLPVLYLTARQSIQAVAWGVVCIYFVRWLLLVHAILPTFNANWAELLNILRWPFLCAMVPAMLTYVCNYALQGISPFPRLIADMAMAGLTLLVLMRLFGRQILHGSHGDYLLAAGRLPVLLRRLLNISA